MNTIAVQVCSPELMAPCDVCYQRAWIFVPTNRELLHICTGCGNTLRSKRLE